MGIWAVGVREQGWQATGGELSRTKAGRATQGGRHVASDRRGEALSAMTHLPVHSYIPGIYRTSGHKDHHGTRTTFILWELSRRRWGF